MKYEKVVKSIDPSLDSAVLVNCLVELPADTTGMVADAFDNERFWLPSAISACCNKDASSSLYGSSYSDSVNKPTHASAFSVNIPPASSIVLHASFESFNRTVLPLPSLSPEHHRNILMQDMRLEAWQLISQIGEGYSSPFNLIELPSKLPSCQIFEVYKEETKCIPQKTFVPIFSQDIEANAKCRKIGMRNQSRIRALTAYNFFVMYEKQRLSTLLGDTDLSGLSSESSETVASHYMEIWWNDPARIAMFRNTMLQHHWLRDRSRRRSHRRTHFGRVSYTSLTRRIASTWHELPKHVKEAFQSIADEDGKRYNSVLSKMLISE